MAAACMTRQPFAELSVSRYQQIQNLSSKQSALKPERPASLISPSIVSSGKKRSRETCIKIHDGNDTENIDPLHLASPTKKSRSLGRPALISLTTSQVRFSNSTTPPDGTSKISTSLAPHSAPAKISALRKFNLNAVDERYASPVSLVTKLRSTKVPKSWTFDIHEDVIEPENNSSFERLDAFLSTNTVKDDIVEDRGKENIAPEGYATPTIVTRSRSRMMAVDNAYTEGESPIYRETLAELVTIQDEESASTLQYKDDLPAKMQNQKNSIIISRSPLTSKKTKKTKFNEDIFVFEDSA